MNKSITERSCAMLQNIHDKKEYTRYQYRREILSNIVAFVKH